MKIIMAWIANRVMTFQVLDTSPKIFGPRIHRKIPVSSWSSTFQVQSSRIKNHQPSANRSFRRSPNFCNDSLNSLFCVPLRSFARVLSSFFSRIAWPSSVIIFYQAGITTSLDTSSGHSHGHRIFHFQEQLRCPVQCNSGPSPSARIMQ